MRHRQAPGPSQEREVESGRAVSAEESLSPELRKEVAAGLLYAHNRLGANSRKTLDVSAFLYALIELLSAKGVITIEELDGRKSAVAKRLVDRNRENGNGVLLQDPEYDKYAFDRQVEIDCAGRIEVCKAACCRLPFALSRQDIREGIVHWSLGEPYLIDHDGNGYCRHADRKTLACTVYPHRPVPCRAFDCRHDKRIWVDYERKIINPDVYRPDWPRCLAQETDKEIAGQPTPVDTQRESRRRSAETQGGADLET